MSTGGRPRRRRWRSRNLGEIELVPRPSPPSGGCRSTATWRRLWRAAGARPPERFMTRMVPGADGRPRAALWDGDAGYRDGDPDRPGPRRRLWLDEGGWHIEITV